jgi:PBP1b-binding outer membrane lipoprotein LpoB
MKQLAILASIVFMALTLVVGCQSEQAQNVVKEVDHVAQATTQVASDPVIQGAASTIPVGGTILGGGSLAALIWLIARRTYKNTAVTQ